jgi:hypothetical protein
MRVVSEGKHTAPPAVSNPPGSVSFFPRRWGMPDTAAGRQRSYPPRYGIDLNGECEEAPREYRAPPPRKTDMQPFAEFIRELDSCLKDLEAAEARGSPPPAPPQQMPSGREYRFQPYDPASGCEREYSQPVIERPLAAGPTPNGARSFQELWSELEASLNKRPRPR